MKKAVGIFTALCLVIAMSACAGGGGSVTNDSSSKNNTSKSSTSEKATEKPTKKIAKLSYEDKYNQYIKDTVIPEIGLYTDYDIKKDYFSNDGTYLNPGAWCTETGMISAKITDLNGDDIPELIVPYLKSEYISSLKYKKDKNCSVPYLSIYTTKNDKIEKLTDVRMSETVDYSWQDMQLFINEYNGIKYLCFNDCAMHADFGNEDTLLFITYDGKEVSADMIFSPVNSIGYTLGKSENCLLNDYDCNKLYSDQPNYVSLVKRQISMENPSVNDGYKEEYDNCFKEQIEKYGLSFTGFGEGLFRGERYIDTSKTDNIFFVHSDVTSGKNPQQIATVTDFTDVLRKFGNSALNKSEKTTEKPTDNSSSDSSNNEVQNTDGCTLQSIGYVNGKLCYTQDHQFEYVENDIASPLPDNIKDKVGKFMVIDDYIYYIPMVGGSGGFSVEFRKMKQDGSDDQLVDNYFSYGSSCYYTKGYLLYYYYNESANDYKLVILNLKTGEKKTLSESYIISEATDGKFYGVYNHSLYEIDAETAQATNFGYISGDIKCVENGYVYYNADTGAVGRINLSNGQSDTFNIGRCMFMVMNNIIYYTPYNGNSSYSLADTSDIRSYNIETGEDTLLSTVSAPNGGIKRFEAENAYLVYTIANGNTGNGASDYIFDVNTKTATLVSNYVVASF
ncbi:MAG: DUF5050 domain-containing protein [Ruminococcus sp.]|nr:DUF5050 domain-containing protein [Ruminococcus sp.]